MQIGDASQKTGALEPMNESVEVTEGAVGEIMCTVGELSNNMSHQNDNRVSPQHSTNESKHIVCRFYTHQIRHNSLTFFEQFIHQLVVKDPLIL